MKTLLNSEYVFKQGNVELTLYLNYMDKTYDIQEPGQEGVFYGKSKDVSDGLTKAELLVEVMEFVGDQFYGPTFGTDDNCCEEVKNNKAK